MWFLPGLDCAERVWRLPLVELTSARLVLLSLKPWPPAPCDWAAVLAEDVPLSLWALCRSGLWRESPPTCWQELTDWMSGPGALLLIQVEPQLSQAPRDLPAPRDQWPSINALPAGAGGVALGPLGAAAAANLTPGGGHSPANATARAGSNGMDEVFSGFLGCLAAQAAAWFNQSGPAMSVETLVAETPWFPRWLAAGASGDTALPTAPEAESFGGEPRPQADPQAGDRIVASLAACLPDALRGCLRRMQLEQRFTEQLAVEKLESLRQLAYGASHEINNPLANIASRAQSLIPGEANPERRRQLDAIVRQAFRAHEMIADLMLFARPPCKDECCWEVAELIGELAREFERDATGQGTTFRWDVPPGIRITADRTQIAIAVKALLRNALEALGQGGSVELLCRGSSEPDMGSSPARQLQIQVSDTGPGLSAEASRHLFDPFYSGRESGRGLGFGLSKCWRIVREHRGQVTVDSHPGRGTAVTIHLPVCPPPAGRPTETAAVATA